MEESLLHYNSAAFSTSTAWRKYVAKGDYVEMNSQITSWFETPVNLAAIAEIVQELAREDSPHRQDAGWLRKRASTAGLSAGERAALEALQQRLAERDPKVLDKLSTATWD